MTDDRLLKLLRSATEDDVLKALDCGHIKVPLTEPTELLEFYHRVVDVLLDTQSDSEAAAALRIKPGFGSTES